MSVTDLRIIMVALILIIGFSGTVTASEEPAFDRRTPVVKVYEQAHEAVVDRTE